MYHYAGNNPVRYTDPDGRAGWEQQFFRQWLEDAANGYTPTQGETFNALMNGAEQQFATEAQVVQTKLSDAMEKTMDVTGDVIVAGAEFMSDYGGVIAIACYASGNIGLGMIIDGVSIACNITLTANKYYNDEISGTEAMVDVAETVIATGLGYGYSSNFQKAAQKVLLDSKTTEIVSDCISDFIGQGYTTLVQVQSIE